MPRSVNGHRDRLIGATDRQADHGRFVILRRLGPTQVVPRRLAVYPIAAGLVLLLIAGVTAALP